MPAKRRTLVACPQGQSERKKRDRATAFLFPPCSGDWGSWRTLYRKIRSQGAIMSVKKEASGRRSIKVEVGVPGTPEEVWQAIATGPGISAWFTPAKFEERDGKPVAVI